MNSLPALGPQSLSQGQNPGIQTSTPAAASLSPNTPLNIAYGAPMSVPNGQYTNNPASNLGSGAQIKSTPTGGLTFPASQAAKFQGGGASSTQTPSAVNTSSFTPAQLASFNSANELGSGVQTTGAAPTGSTASQNLSPNGDNPQIPQYNYINGYYYPVNQTPQGLGQYNSQTTTTAGGGTMTYNPQNGEVMSYQPSGGYQIDTSGSVPSDALSSGSTPNSVMNQQGSYSDYVNALAQAQGYSPQYIAAQQGVWQGQANAATLGEEPYAAAGNPLGLHLGDTMGYANSAIGAAGAANTAQETESQIALAGQQLARTGNIAAASTELQSSPTGIAASQAITAYQNLQTQYPGAGIPPFDPNQDPVQQYANAQALVAQSPAYQAGFQSTYQQPGGGTGIYSKLNLNGLQQNQDGTYTLVPSAAAALGAANAQNVSNNLQSLSNINGAITSSGQTIQSMTQFMNQYGLNQANIPIVNQVANAVKAQTAPAGAIAALQVDLNTLQSDYAQFLIGRGGSVAGSNQEAAAAIPADISPSQMQMVYSQMQQDGINTATALSQQVNTALSGITNNSVPAPAGGTGNPFTTSFFPSGQ